MSTGRGTRRAYSQAVHTHGAPQQHTRHNLLLPWLENTQHKNKIFSFHDMIPFATCWLVLCVIKKCSIRFHREENDVNAQQIKAINACNSSWFFLFSHIRCWIWCDILWYYQNNHYNTTNKSILCIFFFLFVNLRNKRTSVILKAAPVIQFIQSSSLSLAWLVIFLSHWNKTFLCVVAEERCIQCVRAPSSGHNSTNSWKGKWKYNHPTKLVWIFALWWCIQWHVTCVGRVGWELKFSSIFKSTNNNKEITWNEHSYSFIFKLISSLGA